MDNTVGYGFFRPNEGDIVTVYYPDGGYEVMTRGELRAKLIAWLNDYFGPSAEIVTSPDGASARVISSPRRRGNVFVVPPWTMTY